MVKHVGIFFLIIVCVIAMSIVAHTSPEASSSKGDGVERQYPIAAGVWYPGDPVPEEASRYYRIRCWPGCHSYGEFADPKNIKTSNVEHHQYPIAAGVWYPGDPVPEEASRYYRIRCWPGCHSYGEFADPENVKKASEKKSAM
jgi:hypothetical protein